jgi:hypothetical protein
MCPSKCILFSWLTDKRGIFNFFHSLMLLFCFCFFNITFHHIPLRFFVFLTCYLWSRLRGNMFHLSYHNNFLSLFALFLRYPFLIPYSCNVFQSIYLKKERKKEKKLHCFCCYGLVPKMYIKIHIRTLLFMLCCLSLSFIPYILLLLAADKIYYVWLSARQI